MKQSLKILVVDDEPDIRELLAITLHRMGLDSHIAETLAQAKELLKKHSYVLCLADMRLADGDGIELVKWIQEYYPLLPVAIITAYGNVEGAVNTLKAGAFDYVSKPIHLDMLRSLVNTALQLFKEQQHHSFQDIALIGGSQQMVQLKKTITKIARSQAPVLIQGPTGCGKELVAKLIHESSPRRNKPFIPINCGAIPLDLMESEFFGHKKGSFTGAHGDKKGLFQAAHTGTLFLDEIADLPLPMQVKLLRAIQEKAIRPIGEKTEESVDVRIVSATHKDLKSLTANGQFRQDLYYRINVIELKVPSLRERMEDLPLLVQAIIAKISASHQQVLPIIDVDCITKLNHYHFPGNIRELENILERAVTLCENGKISPADIELPENRDIQWAYEKVNPSDMDLDSYLGEQEKAIIMQALEKAKWNKTRAAKELGLSFRSLRYRLKKLGLE